MNGQDVPVVMLAVVPAGLQGSFPVARLVSGFTKNVWPPPVFHKAPNRMNRLPDSCMTQMKPPG